MERSIDEETALDGANAGEIGTALLEDSKQRGALSPLWIHNRPLYVASWILVLLFSFSLSRYTGLDLQRILLVWMLLWGGQIALVGSIAAVAWKKRRKATPTPNSQRIGQRIHIWMDFCSFCTTKFLLLWSLVVVLVLDYRLLYWISSLRLSMVPSYALSALCAFFASIAIFVLVKLYVRLAIVLVHELESMLQPEAVLTETGESRVNVISL